MRVSSVSFGNRTQYSDAEIERKKKQVGEAAVGTSAVANSDKYMDTASKVRLTEEEKKKEHALNTTANVMAGANTVAGAVETGLNISLITLTKKLMEQANRCEEVLQQ